ncbi:PGAP1-like protein-domain-containing protein [Scleroderma citrinum]
MTRTTVLGVLALLAVYTVYYAVSDVPRRISPQGCRMSWMSPSYLLQSEFNTSWTPLASRYSLWLYREVGWEFTQPMGLPALFIPGSAGSSHQVRSIASSAARQYFSSPFLVSEEFSGREMKPLDLYAVDFNEDFSAFHGPTLDSQIAYTSAAITYILSQYPPNTKMIIMGHSMGGVVGTALLPSPDISAIITMSTPHTLPPVRFDPRIEEIYARNRHILLNDETPFVSLCGGARDLLVSSESCVLPEVDPQLEVDLHPVYRRTVFTSALEGAWTGVGHLEMVWCHQVRWRVARVALELGGAAARTLRARATILDRWLGDGHVLPLTLGPPQEEAEVDLKRGTYETLAEGMHLALKSPRVRRTYLLPITPVGENESGARRTTFVLYVSGGGVLSVAPHHALDLRASVQFCVPSSGADLDVESVRCVPLEPTTLRLLPSPRARQPFPVPEEGSDESDGVVLFEAEIPSATEGWVGVSVDAGEQAGGWVVGGFDSREILTNNVGLAALVFGIKKIQFTPADSGALRIRVHFPQLPLQAVLVYSLVPRLTESPSCTDPLFPPLLMHRSRSSEIHYYPLRHNKPLPIHSHAAAPYLQPVEFHPSPGLDLVIYSSGPSCDDPVELSLTIDWWGSLGRLGTRYPTTLLSFCIATVSFVLFHDWRPSERPQSVSESLEAFVSGTMPRLMAAAAIAALLPLGPKWYLGLSGDLGLLASVLAVLLVGIASGLVCLSWWVLQALMKPEDPGLRCSTVASMALVLLFIFLFVPWQVAFLGCWIIQLLNCAAHVRDGQVSSMTNTPVQAIPLRPQDGDNHGNSSELTEDGVIGCSVNRGICRSLATHAPAHRAAAYAFHQNAHILLLLTWLLPLTAPVLAVWVRTLLTAGYTTPFNGDHNVFKVAPILWLLDFLGRGRTFDTRCRGKLSPRWGFVTVGVMSMLMGGRWVYLAYDAAIAQVCLVLFLDIALWYFR